MTTEPGQTPLPTKIARLESEVGTHAHYPHLRVFEQLKQRNVFRVGALYLVVCWLILDPLHVVFHMLEVPAWANRLVIMLMAVGFPAALIFAWVYEVTPAGLKPTTEVPHGESIRGLTGRRLDRAIIAVLAVALAFFVVDKFWLSKRTVTAELTASATPVAAATPTATPAARIEPGVASVAAFTPPPHSLAVLPFVNMSGDKDQEYFSDGLSEELLNALSRVSELQVAARTSSFYFKGKDVDVGTVARKLNVGTVLEGSVRRAGQTVRITAQLVNAVTGYHLWSQTYDRNLRDVLAVQTEIADAVTSALRVTLLGGVGEKVELGATRNPDAFDAYLRGLRLSRTATSAVEMQRAIQAYSAAVARDPGYALAYAGRSFAQALSLDLWGTRETKGSLSGAARGDAERAIALAPALGEAWLALAYWSGASALDYPRALDAFERAAALAPGSASVLSEYGLFASDMGRVDAGLAAVRRAVALDPLNYRSQFNLGRVLVIARRYADAITAYDAAIAADPGQGQAYGRRGYAYILMADPERARASCEAKADNYGSWVCLAVAYNKLARQRDADAMIAKLIGDGGDLYAYQFGQIYAQWGQVSKALDWLETALRMRDSGLAHLRADPMFDPLRKEPRFQTIERALKFPAVP